MQQLHRCHETRWPLLSCPGLSCVLLALWPAIHLVDGTHRHHSSSPPHPVVHKLPVGAQPGALVQPANNRGQAAQALEPALATKAASAAAVPQTPGGRWDSLAWLPWQQHEASCTQAELLHSQSSSSSRSVADLATRPYSRAVSWKQPMVMAELPKRRWVTKTDTLLASRSTQSVGRARCWGAPAALLQSS